MKTLQKFSFLILILLNVQVISGQSSKNGLSVSAEQRIYELVEKPVTVMLKSGGLEGYDHAKLNIVRHHPDGRPEIIRTEMVGGNEPTNIQFEETGYYKAELLVDENGAKIKGSEFWFHIIGMDENVPPKPVIITDSYSYFLNRNNGVSVNYAYENLIRNVPEQQEAILRVYKVNKDGFSKLYSDYRFEDKVLEQYSAGVTGNGEGAFTFYEEGNYEMRIYYKTDGMQEIHASARFYVFENEPSSVPYITTEEYVHASTEAGRGLKVSYEGFPANRASYIYLYRAVPTEYKVSFKKVQAAGSSFWLDQLDAGNYSLKVFDNQQERFVEAGSRFYVVELEPKEESEEDTEKTKDKKPVTSPPGGGDKEPEPDDKDKGSETGDIQYGCELIYNMEAKPETFAKEFVRWFYEDPVCALKGAVGPEQYDALPEQQRTMAVEMMKELVKPSTRKFGGFDRIKKVEQLSRDGNLYHFQVVVEYLDGSVENFQDVEVLKGNETWRGRMNKIKGFTKDSF